jgi:uncharacterized protein
MLRIAVDTNQYIAGFLYHGMMRAVFLLVLESKLTLYASPKLNAEVGKKLQYFHADEQVQNEVLSFIDEKSSMVEPTITIDVCRDKEDNFALELAETADADYLVTRDKDLLDMQHWKRTEIIKPEDFLPLLRRMKLLD